MSGGEHAKAVLTGSYRLTPVWLLPIAALLIVAWLGWHSYQSRGVDIQIQFDSGKGLKPGKTQVMHNGLEVGRVKSLLPSNDMRSVNAIVSIQPQYKQYLTEQSQFWLIKPQITMAGISGLDTLVSGNYIAFAPSAKGAETRHFQALKKVPAQGETSGGLQLNLKAQELGSINEGSPVYFRRFQVGEVTRYSLSPDGQFVDIELFIEKPFVSLIKKNTRFWNASGINVTGSLYSVNVRTQSLLSIIKGGIAFYTPEWENAGEAAVNGDEFLLYTDYEQAEAGIPIAIEFPVNVALGKANTDIFFHGFKIGRVQAVDISEDLSKIIAKAVILPEMQPVLVEGAQFWVVEPQLGINGISGLDTLLTGRYIAMDVSQKNVKRAKFAKHFIGRGKKPFLPASSPGLHLTLKTNALSGISSGSPVLFRDIQVGTVQDYQLTSDGVDIHLLIKPEYDHLVNKSTRFWNISGVNVEADLNGIKVKSSTLNTFLAGGITFQTPQPKAQKIKNGTSFWLFTSEADATDQGVHVTIRFDSAEGLKEGTLVKYRGLKVGRITGLAIDANRDGVVADVSLEKKYQWLASEGAEFWVVRPKLGLTGASHLETLIHGSYIGVELIREQPGVVNRKIQTHFTAIAHEPGNKKRSQGLNLELVSQSLGSVKRGNGVFYRGIPVGQVTGYKLGNPADHVVIYINIDDRFTNLVGEDSRFWNASGIDATLGFFSGARVKTESLETLLAGGIAFATPSVPEQPVKSGQRFKLFAEGNGDWLKWKPEIPLQ
ncbi:intermembrane transport protein PqiB [Candidatus Sororendozoicomonas aggregata]|uniref:PqiB family protein n=1 Tax=Candidatus Sororendozoicomonas aggregata TaxID=3073239 RepID=UPI002ED155F0